MPFLNLFNNIYQNETDLNILQSYRFYNLCEEILEFYMVLQHHLVLKNFDGKIE